MPEAEKEPGQEVQTEQAPKKSRGPLMLIIIAVVGFIACIAVFSLMMGVFSSGEKGAQPTSENDSEQITAVDSTAKKEGAHTDVAALEKELFDSLDVTSAKDMDEIMQMVEESSNGIDQKDSAAIASWLSKEKANLKKERASLDARKDELDKQEYRLNQTMEKINQVQSNRVAALAKLYDGMKAEQVAPLINKLSEEQSVQVLLKMKPANAAKVLGVINPDRAARISAKMITFAEE